MCPLETNQQMQTDVVTDNLISHKLGGHRLEFTNKTASPCVVSHIPAYPMGWLEIVSEN